LACDAACEATGGILSDACGVALTISKGLIEELEAAAQPSALAPREIWRYDAAAAAREVAQRLQCAGPLGAAVAACASGLASVKLAQEWLRDERCTVALAGAAESTRSPLILRSFARLGVLNSEGVTRPFDAHRAGFVVGEGAGVVCLENAARARADGRAVLGFIRSLVLAGDGFHLTSPDPNGTALAHAIAAALDRAELAPARIGWIHAHGTGTPYNDAVEIRALRTVFKNRVPPVTATKGLTGHLLGASGAVALVLTLRALNEGTCPPITNLQKPDAEFEGIDFVQGPPRKLSAAHALILNHGFGGHIAVAVVQRGQTA
jgi:3-oxoacyl-[acyl-carrier-protein] synthase II